MPIYKVVSLSVAVIKMFGKEVGAAMIHNACRSIRDIKLHAYCIKQFEIQKGVHNSI